MTADDLGKILHEEFDRDAWGDIDPELFRLDSEWADDPENVDAMRRVLERIARRLSQKPSSKL